MQDWFEIYMEDRSHPLKSACELPRRWALREPSLELSSSARPGEFFVFQIGIHHTLASVATGLSW